MTEETQTVDLYDVSDENLMQMTIPSESPVTAEKVSVSDTNKETARLDEEELAPEGSPEDDASSKIEKPEEELLDSEDGIEEPEEEEAPLEVSDEDIRTYMTTHETIFKPFKANGKEMQVKSVDEAIRLMQMGANYHKKTRELAPYTKIVHMLEKNNLTSEEDLGFLIDVYKKDPGAINKLLEDSGLDPLDLPEKGKDYTPGNHSVSDSEAELRVILAENQSDTEFQGMLNQVMSWDSQSKHTISSNPQLLRILADNKRTGAYDLVMAEVERRQTLGDFQGQPVLQAYRQVVSEMMEATPVTEKGAKPKSTVTPQPSKSETERQIRRRAAARPAAKPEVTQGQSIDLNSMSDEDLLKLNI